MSCRLKPSTDEGDSSARFRADGLGAAGGAVCLSSPLSREEEDAASESWAVALSAADCWWSLDSSDLGEALSDGSTGFWEVSNGGDDAAAPETAALSLIG